LFAPRPFILQRGEARGEANGGTDLAVAYEKLLDSGRLSEDPAQHKALARLTELAALLEFSESTNSRRYGFFRRRRRRKAPKGLYIFGDVGRGKTLLMDLFFAQVGIAHKRRVHFHAFMDEVHQNIADIRAQQAEREARRGKSGNNFDPVALVAKPIIKQTRLLCFDEFHVNDITNAMLLGRLFEQFFAAGMVVVATSNAAPDALYKNGLNRELFLPFVELVKARCEIVHLEAARDYRVDKLSSQPIFFFGSPGKVRPEMDRLWDDLVGGLPDKTGEIHLLGRTIDVPRTQMGMARFEFGQLCRRPLGARDYLAIAHSFHTLAIDDVPQFSRANSNEAKRFILLVDTLYDQGVKLAASFGGGLDGLSEDPDTAFEFRRCVSRLKEMASDAYLAAPKSAKR